MSRVETETSTPRHKHMYNMYLHMSVNICIWPDNGSLRGVGYVFHLPRIGDFALIAYQTVNGYRSHKARYLIALPEPASSGTRESNRKITITIHIPSYPIKLRFEHNKLTKGSKCHKNAQCDYFIIICRGNKEHKSSRTRPSRMPSPLLHLYIFNFRSYI